MKTIKDAAIERNGIWPHNDDGMIYHVGNSVVKVQYCGINPDKKHIFADGGVWVWVGTRQEFESCAKRLGYISGYRWGVEYPTNGKRPDLADDVWVMVCDWCQQDVGAINWSEETKFKITDSKLKPADTSYLNGVREIPENKPGAESVIESSDYKQKDEISEAISAFCKLPNSLQDLYQESFDKWVSKRAAEIKASTEREKVIEAAVKIYDDKKCFSAESFASELHKAGMLVLPPKKSDTED